MSGTKPGALPRDAFKGRLTLSLLGVLVVAAGFALPHFWSGSETHQEAVPEKQVVSEKEAVPAKQSALGDELKYSPLPRPEVPDLGALLGRLIAGTVLVLALCVGTLWMGKRWLRLGPAAKTGSGQLQVLEALPLGRRCVLYLVKANNQQIVAGIDPSGLKALLPLSESFETALNDVQPPPVPEVAAAPEVQQPEIRHRDSKIRSRLTLGIPGEEKQHGRLNGTG
jgi:flagellar biogenesis protein FliO